MKRSISLIVLTAILYTTPSYSYWPPSLENCINTCFLNASIQALLNLEHLTATLASSTNPFDKTNKEEEALYHYTELAKEFYENKSESKAYPFTCNTNKPLYNLVQSAYGLLQAAACSQQDASEFIGIFLDKITEIPAMKSIREAFETKAEQTLFCPIQGTLPAINSITKPSFFSLSLPTINEKKEQLTSLKACLQAYFSPTPTQWKDEGNNDRQGCTKKFELLNSPNFLVINLMRYVGSHPNITKTHHKISIPERLNTTEYFASSVKTKKEENEYVLKAAVIHGGSMTSGHYWAYVENNGQWYKCDDKTITKVNFNNPSVQGDIQGGGNASGYVFIYEKTRMAPPSKPKKPQAPPQKELQQIAADLKTLKNSLTQLSTELDKIK